ncbi:cytochrome b N-terminal domain-containing protein [Calderihabitans maritimus]|uniref:Quinol-cytochrome c reductase, fused cytochrome b/c subunit n=1 Tax=Calderihabitans maritimus TaxID=1246530 RepID=A0A1Z5HUL8_9FIRM|nr:cytochrome b N-terminal domain-containing protein [Calderihabitans maritimus]GAW93214.1 quinol-cytochrome c reductase, fused cytochrome b/c subunit [Calderihabitans maritimus]
MRKLWIWLEERTGIGPQINYILYRRLPRGIGWFHTLGSATLFLIFLQVITGLFLTLYYVPSADEAYESILFIEGEIQWGSIIRGIHFWSANFLIVIVFLHMLRVIIWGAYKRPRELTWFVGVIILGIILALSFTGYLLPWNQKAYWATVVGTEILGTIPVVGSFIKEAVRADTVVGPLTLTRFFSLHVLWLPGLLMILIIIHVALVIRHGIAEPPPKSFLRTYSQLKGSAFFPDHVLKDALVSVGLFIVIMYLAITVGAEVGEPADPATVNVVPKPEWYFMFFYKLLWFFPGKFEVVGTFLIPVIIGSVLFLLPVLDRGPGRHLFQRPVVVGVTGILVASIVYLTILGLTTPKPPGTVEIFEKTELPEAVVAGYEVYTKYGCAACHVVRDVGVPVGPRLDSKRWIRRSEEYLEKILADPKLINPRYEMPRYEDIMSKEERQELIKFIRFLEQS